MNLRSLFLAALATTVVCSAAFAGNRHFYHHQGKAYYCQQPAAYQQGCYVVCDEPNVTRIGNYPTITTAEAERLRHSMQTGAPVAQGSPQRSAQGSVEDWCCGKGPDDSPANCWPKLYPQCYCTSAGVPEYAPESHQGPLHVYVKPGSSYYYAIVAIEGTIPVPQICVTKDEKYAFGPLTLAYACETEIANSDQAGVCTFPDPCDTPCTITTCEVVSRTADCTAQCVPCDTKGPLVLAIRLLPDGTYVADVFIGTEGKAGAFKAYPTTMMVLTNASEAQVNEKLKLADAEALNFGQLAADPNNRKTDLFAWLK